MKRLFTACSLLAALAVGGASALSAQGVTTSQIRGTVSSPSGPLGGAQITAIHEPSGSRYTASTRPDGRFTIPGMRVGGPYTISAIAIGFERQSRTNVFLTLGQATDVNFAMREAIVQLEDLTVAAQAGVMTSTRTGASTSIGQEELAALPTISRNLRDFTRLTPQVRGTSFAGADGRLNNITVDGAFYNNSFGLGDGQPGGRTSVAPIPLDAIEQVQVNIAPYDVRQGGFVGAGVNTVTRSGTNNFEGSLYYQYRNDGFVGTQAGALPFDPGTFKFDNIGFRLGGPIIRNKLFFFANYESDAITQPGTNFRANNGGETPEGTVTRVLKSDLDQLSAYLRDNFGYETGPYQDYDFETPSKRYVAKLNWNVNDRNKVSLRYTRLDSETDQLASNSSSLGFGNRRTRIDALNFANTNYVQAENIRTITGEINSLLGANMANQLIVGYNESDESRPEVGGAGLFPLVDILEEGRTYTSFGYEPFTPRNQLRYNSYQLQNNFSIYGNRHDLTFGVALEKYRSDNVFFPGSQSAYVYNSLDDFYTDANDYLANPNRTTSPVELRRFQVRYANIPGSTEPLQPLEVFTAGLYVQDVWRATDNLELTVGVRADRPSFGDTGFENPEANGYSFRNAAGQSVQYRTERLPDANILFSPRVGFNWDVKGDRSTQVRGGTGIFSGRPLYVWISNQIGENGLLTGFEQQDETFNRPFNPDPNAYKPVGTGAPAPSYGLAFTDPDFRFPQQWRSNLAIDHQFRGGWVGTVEFIYGRDVNGISYIDANLPANQTTLAGADNRPRWTNRRINSNVTGAFVLGNQNEGYNWNIGGSLERSFSNGFFAKVAYNYGESKNLIDPGSIAAGSWQNNPIALDPNNPVLSHSVNSPGHRFFAALSYKRDFFSFGTTGISVFFEAADQGRGSYTFSGDLNGDGGFNNDLIYVHRDQSEMNFQQYSSGGVTFTPEQQAAAWDAYIEQDSYLSTRRGQYAERNAAVTPLVWRADLSITQDLFAQTAGKLSNLQIRLDILNFTNLINSDWGVGERFVSVQPLTNPSVGQDGRPTYRLRSVGGELMSQTFEKTAGLSDVYQIQLGLRYSFR